MTRHNTIENFLEQLVYCGDCIAWGGLIETQGYGVMRMNGKSLKAHRISYEYFVSGIPNGLEIDHLCRNRACVNPAHLEAVDHHVNVLRGECGAATARIQQEKEMCPKGHQYDLANTYRNKRGHRFCRKCARIRANENYKRSRITIAVRG